MLNWESNKHELAQAIRTKRFGLITDVDGTISLIVDEPDAARVTPGNLRLLSQIQERMPLVAVISGRAADDVARRIGLPGLVYLGNHGMETWTSGKVEVSAEVEAYRGELLAAMLEIKRNMISGMRLEDKGATLSVHYRQTDAPEKVAVDLKPTMKGIANRNGLVLTQGRMVFEFRPPINVDKGTAFKKLVFTYQLEAAFFIGDDTTDVHALQVARCLRKASQCLSYGLAVKSQGTPPVVLAEADFYIEEVAGVESFLGWVLASRIASST